jgi:5-methylcytosine-specific restriction endonuclease McrA
MHPPNKNKMAEQTEETRLNWTLKTLYLYLGNAVMCIPKRYQQQVYQDMAHKLMEWNDMSCSELRKVFAEYDIEFEKICIHCNEDVPDWSEYDDCDPVCDACKKEYGDESESEEEK